MHKEKMDLCQQLLNSEYCAYEEKEHLNLIKKGLQSANINEYNLISLQAIIERRNIINLIEQIDLNNFQNEYDLIEKLKIDIYRNGTTTELWIETQNNHFIINSTAISNMETNRDSRYIKTQIQKILTRMHIKNYARIQGGFVMDLRTYRELLLGLIRTKNINKKPFMPFKLIYLLNIFDIFATIIQKFHKFPYYNISEEPNNDSPNYKEYHRLTTITSSIFKNKRRVLNIFLMQSYLYVYIGYKRGIKLNAHLKKSDTKELIFTNIIKKDRRHYQKILMSLCKFTDFKYSKRSCCITSKTNSFQLENFQVILNRLKSITSN